jgi:hypothetical protein
MFRVNFTNFQHSIEFKDFFNALNYAKEKGFESRINFEDKFIASWSPITGLIIYQWNVDHSLLTSKRAAFLLGISQRRVNQFCKEGRLGKKVGSTYIITWDELEKFANIPRMAGRKK